MLMPRVASVASDIDALRFARVSVVNLPVSTEDEACVVRAADHGVALPYSFHSIILRAEVFRVVLITSTAEE